MLTSTQTFRNLSKSLANGRGQAVGGLGGGIWMSVIYPNSAPPYSGIHALRSTGGWAQLKVRPTQQWEFNGAIGQDENDGKDLRFFPTAYASYGFSPFQKNAARFVNAIYRPCASLLLAAEYRRLFTNIFGVPAASGDQVNVAAGVQF